MSSKKAVILEVGIPKGGDGKSMISRNLAVMRAKEGRDVLLIDADSGNDAPLTSSLWSAMRDQNEVKPRITCIQKAGNDIHKDIYDLATRYDDVIVDIGRGNTQELRSAMTVADILCVPFRATQDDIWSLPTVQGLVEQVRAINPNLKAYAVINLASPNPRIPETQRAIDCLDDFPDIAFSGVVIRERIAFSRAMALGLSVMEYQPVDQKAIDEITNLYNVLYGKAT